MSVLFITMTPESLDSYYQEIGRAGRDGERADATLFFRRQDIGAQSYKTGAGKVDPETLEGVLNKLAGAADPVPVKELAEDAGLSQRKAEAVLQTLEDAGAVESLPAGEVELVPSADLAEAVSSAVEAREQRREANRERLEQMRAYADAHSCRREILLRYFGDTFTGPCGFCDNCEGLTAPSNRD